MSEPRAPQSLPSRAWSGATLAEGAALVERQQVKLERAPSDEELEAQIEVSLVTIVE